MLSCPIWQIKDYALAADSICALMKQLVYPGDDLYNLHNLELNFKFGVCTERLIFKLTSGYLLVMDDRTPNEKVAMCKLPLENPIGDISYYHCTKTRSEMLSFNHDAMKLQPVIGSNIDDEASNTNGVMSSYTCTGPTLNLGPHGAILCDKNVIGNIQVDLKILTRMVPVSLLEDLWFDLVEWYMHYINQQDFKLFKKSILKAYLSCQKPTSMASDAMTKVKLGFPTEIQVSPEWNASGSHTLTAELEDLPSLMAILNDETTPSQMGDKDAHHSYDCQWIMFCSWNEVTYTSRLPKPYNLEDETMTKSLIMIDSKLEYPLQN